MQTSQTSQTPLASQALAPRTTQAFNVYCCHCDCGVNWVEWKATILFVCFLCCCCYCCQCWYSLVYMRSVYCCLYRHYNAILKVIRVVLLLSGIPFDSFLLRCLRASVHVFVVSCRANCLHLMISIRFDSRLRSAVLGLVGRAYLVGDTRTSDAALLLPDFGAYSSKTFTAISLHFLMICVIPRIIIAVHLKRW